MSQPAAPVSPRAGNKLGRVNRVAFLLAVLALLVAACSSTDDSDDAEPEAPDSPTNTEEASESPGAESDPVTRTDEDSDPSDKTADDTDVEVADEVVELGRGVTDDTIAIAFTYLDLDDLREQGVIDLNHGPRGEHIQVLVDDLNANGGIHGRQIELITAEYTPLDQSAHQRICLELTEDHEVFAVLGSVRGDNVLCYTEQHDMIAILGQNMTQERLDRSTAPFATATASEERSIRAFVDSLVEAGLFEGLKLAVHSTDASPVARDIALPALQHAGVEVAFESFIEGDGTLGGAADAVAVNVENMRSRNIDAVLIIGDAVLATNTFIGEDFLPTMFFANMGNAQAVTLRADVTVFPALYTFGGFTAVARFEEPTFQRECASVWNAARPDDPVIYPNDVADREPNHVVGLTIACQTLKIFRLAAQAAGPNLNNDTFQAALDGIGEFSMPGLGPASLGQGKYDAQDDLRLWVYDPDVAVSDSGFTPVKWRS